MITNNSLIVTQTLEYFTPKLNGWKLSVLVGSASIIALIAIMIQSAVYRSLKSLGSRHINQMIIPSLVKVSVNIYLYSFMFLILVTFYIYFLVHLAVKAIGECTNHSRALNRAKMTPTT